ncbi:hypothetical protein [Burkholderia anthina]|nr:hypothetical protein [Burkholderia anthina]
MSVFLFCRSSEGGGPIRLAIHHEANFMGARRPALDGSRHRDVAA